MAGVLTPLLLACAALVAGVIQRITGLGFVLVLTAPVILLYGAFTGTAMSVFLALIASLAALPLVWKQIVWRRVLWLLLPAAVVAPLAAWAVRLLPEPAILLLIAALAAFALTASRIPGFSRLYHGRSGTLTAGASAGALHVASGMSGPVLGAYAVATGWEQRSFAASVQAVFVGLSLLAVLFRGLPPVPASDLVWGGVATAAGIVVGSLLVRFVPAPIARQGMLGFAWLGTIVVLVRGIAALAG